MGLFSMFGNKAEAILKKAIDKANERNYEEAIEDYSEVISMKGASDDVKFQARYNRALAYSCMKDNDKAKKDLQIIIDFPKAPNSVKSYALEKMKRIKKRERAASKTDDDNEFGL